MLIVILSLLCSCKKNEKKSLYEDGREILVLAATDGDSALDNIITSFNNQSEEYYIEQRNYVLMDTGLYTGNEKLIMDITRNKEIDILYNSNLDMEVYLNKNLLADMYVLIDEDNEVSRDTYMEGVLKAFESNGRLCSMPTFYYMQTTIGKERIWCGDRNVSIENLTKKANELDIVPIANLSKNATQFSDTHRFAYYLKGTLNEYVDFENNTCNFTDGRFERLLNFANMYDIENENPNELFANGKSLLHHVTIDDFDDMDMYKCLFGSDIVFMGFPSDTPNYHNIMSTESFSILENSNNKHGAFEFIKYITSYDYQFEKSFGNFFPINKKVFDTRASFSLEEPKNTYYNEDMTIKLEYECTREGIESIVEQFDTTSSGFTYGETMADIIGEEVGAFFSHDKSAADVCDIIQNRISTHLSENAR